MLRLSFPFSVSDPRSPYYMTLLKSLDVLTTWMFLSQGLLEGNPFAREIIRLYGVLPMGVFAMVVMFVYSMVLQIIWNHVDQGMLKWACNLSFNYGMILNLALPLWNLAMMYAVHAMS